MAFARRKLLMRRCTLLLAILALLANSALFAADRFVAGTPGPALAGEHVFHAHHAGGNDSGDRHAAGHQACHFCRLFGAVLPPPPDIVLDERSPADTFVVYAPYVLARPAAHFGTGHPVRGPPRLIG